MKRFIYTTLMCAIFAFAATGCSDDDISGTLTFANNGLYVQGLGESVSTTFTHTNLVSIEVEDYPDGWLVEASFSNKTITAYAPTTTSGDTEGSVIVTGYTETGYTVMRTLYVGFKESISLESVQSNSMVVSTPDRIYTFNPRRKGELTTEDLPEATSCEILWQSENTPISYVHLNADGMLSFYVNLDEEDVDEDDDEEDLIEGNAVVYAMDDDGCAIWSWHIWITESEIGEINMNGNTFMDRNIGARANSNDSTDDILLSYGLYYQWGRKDPFIYPAYYNGSGGIDDSMTDQYSNSFGYEIIDSLGTDGTLDYALSYPWHYMCSDEQENHDWLYTADDDLWSGSSSSKSIYDPCPKGWIMPTSDQLAALTIDDGQSLDSESYGLTLSGGNFFMGAGYRTYATGYLQNINEDYAPWVGYYWSRDVDGEKGAAMAFKYNDGTTSIGIEGTYRANALQVRCIRQ